MNQRAKTSGFVLGLVGGILNGIFLILTLIGLIQIVEYAPASIILILSAVILACILNLVGGCVCRNRRTPGGIMMLISGGLLFIYLIYRIAEGGIQFLEGGIVVAVIWIISEVVSIVGAIICLSRPGIPTLPYVQPYGQPFGQQYAQPQQPYGQPYQPQQPYGQPQQPFVQPIYGQQNPYQPYGQPQPQYSQPYQPQQPNKTEE